jgi:hypothetical protein
VFVTGLDRYPFNSPLVRRMALPLWFTAHSVAGVSAVLLDPVRLFFDGRLYLDATRAWLGGRNPWNVEVEGNLFAAPPTSLLPLAPLTVLPRPVDVAALGFICLMGAILTVRMLRLPWWWLLFPPLVASVLAANVQALLIPLILGRAGGVAVLLKVYAFVPLLLLGRWRALAAGIVMLVASLPVLPWGYFLVNLGEISATLAAQTHYALPTPVLIALAPLIFLAAAVVRAPRAAWLAVPAAWPAQQYYYGTLVLPVANGLVAAIVALPVTGAGTMALLILALWILKERRDATAPPP